MPVLKYLTDTNTVSDYFRPGNPVKDWFAQPRGQIGISTLTLAEMRRGIELKADPKTRAKLERTYDFTLEDYREAIFVFDEAAAAEWDRLMAESRDALPPYDDSLIAAIARSSGLTVITRNEKHFSGVATVNPWKLK
jgi:predicted nucleic acid-binding protein